MVIMKTEALTKIYGKGPGMVTALENAALSVEQGEFIAIVGTSGSGKSTLLHMLGGLDRPTSGKVFVETLAGICQPCGGGQTSARADNNRVGVI